MRSKTFLSSIAVLLILSPVLLWAQVDTGTPPFSSIQGDGFDQVNLGNLNVHFAVPIFARAGRGGFNFSYTMTYDSSVYYPTGSVGNQSWQNVQNWGWQGVTQIQTGFVPALVLSHQCSIGHGNQGTYYTYVYSQYIDSFGISHRFPTQSLTFGGDICVPPVQDSPPATVQGDDGYTFYLNANTAEVYPREGGKFKPPVIQTGHDPGTGYDHNGNKITTDGSNFTDTLNTTALAITGSPTAPPVKFGYINYLGTTKYVQFNYSNHNVLTAFACSGFAGEFSNASIPLVDSISFPDGSAYTITYEATPGASGKVTGRIAQITLPTGGYITYSYTGTHDGINCVDGSTNGLTVVVHDNAAGPWTWTYTRSGSANSWTTTETNPQSDVTTINFQRAANSSNQYFETKRQVGSTAIATVYTCYNGNTSPSGCTTTAVNTPITRRTIYHLLPNSTGKESEVDEYYDTGFDNLTERDEYDFGVKNSGTVGPLLRKTVIAYTSMSQNIDMGAISHTFELPSSVKVYNGSSSQFGQTTYSYDDTTLHTATGVSQHATVTGSRGNLTTRNSYSSLTTSLTSHWEVYDTGALYNSTTPSGAITQFDDADCDGAFSSTAAEPLGLSRSFQWNCTGGVLGQITDENGNNRVWTYTDPNFWRPLAYTDQSGAATTLSYLLSGTVVQGTDSYLTFNSNTSIADQRVTFDGLGRSRIVQRQQAPGSTNYDSVETDYNGFGLPKKNFPAYVGAAGATSPGSPYGAAVNTTYDALGRTKTVVDGNSGTTTYTYSFNDVLRAVTPIPTNDTHSKNWQNEYDGAGRLSSVCEIVSTGGSACGQATSATGYLTQYTYDPLDNLTKVTQGVQTRTYTYDWLGRMLTEQNPEALNATTTYYYDSDPSGTCTNANTYTAGHLAYRKDPNGTVSCYGYDIAGRLTQVTYPIIGNGVANTWHKYYVYDVANPPGTSYTVSNPKGRLVDAFTAVSPTSARVTDTVLGYDPNGRTTQNYQYTVDSGGYNSVATTYYPSGAIAAMTKGGTTFSYSVDSEGRPIKITTNPTWVGAPLNNVTYNQFSSPLTVTLGSNDSDVFGYDPNTGRMNSYKFNINGSAVVTGTLGWNANGTLGSLGIVDTFNTQNTQTCQYGHDDIARISSVTCGTTWAQTFSYDPFGNVTKSGNLTFNPGYTQTTNRYISLPRLAYDSNGNLKDDSFHEYTSLDTENRPVSIDATIGVYYDAFGRMVEQTQGSSHTIIYYDTTGAKSIFASTPTVYLDLPGGAKAVYKSAGLTYYRHSDWLGTSRLTSTASGGASAAIGFVQVNYATPQGSNSSVSATYSATQTQGNTNIIAIGWTDGGSATINSVTDSAGNVYSPAVATATIGSGSSQISQALYYKVNIAGATNNQVTVQFSAAVTSPDLRILEYNNISAIDVTSSGTGNSTAANSGSATTTAANELIFGAATVYTASSGGSGFNVEVITLPDKDLAEDKIAATIGSYNATATLSPSGNWVMQMATFKPTTGTGTSVYSDAAYAPYGESYVQDGPPDLSFTGQNNDTVSDLFDFTMREYHPSQGRWIAPDGAGVDAVDITDPQSLNRYAYVSNNPLASIDLFGLVKPGPCMLAGTCAGGGFTDSFFSCFFGFCDGGIMPPIAPPNIFGPDPGPPILRRHKPKPGNNSNKTCPTVPQHPPGVDVNSNISEAQWAKVLTATAPALSLGIFISMVHNGSAMDYKQPSFGATLTDTGQVGPSPYQDFGNFNYGAVGTAWGIPQEVLLRGAGWAQEQAKTQDPSGEWGHWYQGPPHGDDPADQEQIKQGIQYYQNGCYNTKNPG